MNKSALIVALIVLSFSLGVIADETIKADGWSWQKIVYVRQSGFVEGFAEGEDSAHETLTFKPLCNAEHDGGPVLASICALSRLRGKTYVSIDADRTIETMNRLYASPQNLPIHWRNALIISQAMTSGVSVSEKDLEAIRQRDAMPPKSISEKEMHDILSNTPPKK
jgi:hypothetical protein